MDIGLPLFPEQASTAAGQVDLLFLFLNLLTIFFTVLIAGLITYFAIKYRRRPGREVGDQIIGSTRLEIGWAVALVPLALAAFTWGAILYVDLFTQPDDGLQIYVLGKQWMWKFVHEEGQEEINELHVPVGETIKLTMTSQDVIHSFYVPAFRIKYDVLPGRYTTAWFEATRPGTYHLFCAEYCGTNHARMVGAVVVMEPAEYQAWLSGAASEGSPAAQGQRLFLQLGCAGCHRMDGRGPGPSLVATFGQPIQLQDGRTVIADESYIRESILEPNAKIVAGFEPLMPTFQGQVSEQQLLQLIAYIKSLAGQTGEVPPRGAAPGAEPLGTPSGGATPQPGDGAVGPSPLGTPSGGATPGP